VTDVDEITSPDTPLSKEQQLFAAKEAMAGPTPLMPGASDNRLTLPRGLYHGGTFKKEVYFREITGADEEALAKCKDALDYYDTVLALGVERVEDFDLSELPLSERIGVLRGLLMGERDMVFLGATRATFGDTRTISFACSFCQEPQDMELILSEDLKPQEIPSDLSLDTFDFTTSKGDSLIVRPVTGDDQKEAFARKGATVVEQNTIILSRCIVKLNGGLVPDPMAYARSLSIKDRTTLLAEMAKRQPSIDLGVTTTCAACNQPQTLTLGWGDIFRT
jgi:hypothetical protein